MLNVIHISDYLKPEHVIDIQGTTKEQALNEMLDVISDDKMITDKARFRKEIFKRETLMSTGIGYGIAIPHARHKSITDFVIAVGRSVNGIPYESIDDRPVKLIFMIGASASQDKDYIKLLSRIVLRLKNPEFKERLLAAASTADVYEQVIRRP